MIFKLSICIGFFYLSYINLLDNRKLKYLGIATIFDIVVLDILWLVINTTVFKFYYIYLNIFIIK
jgi:hypothetical protein